MQYPKGTTHEDFDPMAVVLMFQDTVAVNMDHAEAIRILREACRRVSDLENERFDLVKRVESAYYGIEQILEEEGFIQHTI